MPVIAYIALALGVLIGGAVPQVRHRMGIKDPNAERVVTLQSQVETKDKEIARVQDEKDKAVKQERESLSNSTRVAQQFIHGANEELKKDQPNVATVKVLISNADDSLTKIFGPLTDSQKAQIELYIELRSQGKVAEAEKKLAVLQVQLTESEKARQEAITVIANKDKELVTVKNEKEIKVDELHKVTADVVAKAKEITSFSNYLDTIWYWIKIVVFAYIFIHFVMPILDDIIDKHYPPSQPAPLWVRLFHSIYEILRNLTCQH